MAPPLQKKRKIGEAMKGKISKPKRKFKKQRNYNSSSEDESDIAPAEIKVTAVNTQDSDSDNENSVHSSEASEQEESGFQPEIEETLAETGESQSEDDEESDSFSVASSNPASRKKISKRNDPTALSTSINKILSTKLPTSARADPLLSRSRSAVQTTTDLANEKLERRARAKLRAEKKEDMDRDRVRDVLGVEKGESGEVVEREKRFRKIAQRGVVKLFNAVRAAQVRGEEVAREERKNRSIVGMKERDKAVNEVSKQGFLDLINGKSADIEEA